MSQPDSDAQISAVRAFNRFYTRKLGVLDQQLLKSPFSLSEARVLYELAQRGNVAAKEVGIELGLDPGYLSRIIQKFDEDGLITRKALPSDRRQFQLPPTPNTLASFAASRDRCWIADIDGVQVGSVFLVRQTADVAKLRLLLVEPAGRGQGLGRRLVGECISFARACGYCKITLWTQSILLAARKIYQDAGFVRVASEPHRGFGQSLIGETWELEL